MRDTHTHEVRERERKRKGRERELEGERVICCHIEVCIHILSFYVGLKVQDTYKK